MFRRITPCRMEGTEIEWEDRKYWDDFKESPHYDLKESEEANKRSFLKHLKLFKRWKEMDEKGEKSK